MEYFTRSGKAQDFPFYLYPSCCNISLNILHHHGRHHQEPPWPDVGIGHWVLSLPTSKNALESSDSGKRKRYEKPQILFPFSHLELFIYFQSTSKTASLWPILRYKKPNFPRNCPIWICFANVIGLASIQVYWFWVVLMFLMPDTYSRRLYVAEFNFHNFHNVESTSLSIPTETFHLESGSLGNEKQYKHPLHLPSNRNKHTKITIKWRSCNVTWQDVFK